MFAHQSKKHMDNTKNALYRSEGLPRMGLLDPWARWGKGPVAGKSSASSSHDRVGGVVGGGDARTSYFHPTRKQAPDKETNTRQGSKHPTRKQAPDKETNNREENKPL